MKISCNNKKTANFPPTDDCIFFFSGRNQNFPHYKKNVNFPPEPKTNTTAQPARQTTVSFFFPVVIARTAHPSDRRLYLFFPVVMYLFFSGRNENFPPKQKNCQFPANRRLHLFFPVVIKISRHYKKNSNFLPEMTVSFFFRS